MALWRKACKTGERTHEETDKGDPFLPKTWDSLS